MADGPLQPKWTLHHKVDTKLFADSVEWCMVEGYQYLLACGLYQLTEIEGQESKRLGSLLLYEVRQGREIGGASSQDVSVSFKEIYRIEGIAGVLDLKWFPHLIGGCPGVVMAKADGTCCVHSFKFPSESCVESSLVANGNIAPGALCLSVDISRESVADTLVVLTTTSDGEVVSLRAALPAEPSAEPVVLQETQRWKAHGFEAWYAVFDAQNPARVYSGGDDGQFKAVEISDDAVCPVKTVRYDVGLCAMQFRPQHPDQLALGGYGETVWIFDTADLKRPLTEIGVGGGVWRIKWNPMKPNYLATASMYNGFHMLHLSDSMELSVVLHFTNHTENSLGYGISWLCQLCASNADGDAEEDSGTGTQALLATCSFYDHTLQVWSAPLSKA